MNAIQCKHCKKIIKSLYRHHFVTHTCARPDGTECFIAADGGDAYKRRVGDPQDWIEVSSDVGNESDL